MYFIDKGGSLMWLLLLCSIASLFIYLERLFYFYKSKIDINDFLFGIRNLIKNNSFNEAIRECITTPGPVARIVHSAISNHSIKRSKIKEVVKEVAHFEIRKLERRVSLLMTITYLAPLLGLLGSVLGLLTTFSQISSEGFSTVTEISQGMYKALISSAIGLTVAIPSFIFYSHLKSYLQLLITDMEISGTEIVNEISEFKNNNKDIISIYSNESVKNIKDA